MNIKKTINNVAKINVIVGLVMVFPFILAWLEHEKCQTAFMKAAAITLLLNGIIILFTRGKSKELSIRDGWLIAVLSWCFAGFFGSLPFLLAHVFGAISIENFVNCYFESISGLTTTGSSVLGGAVPIESLEDSLLFWRSLTHFLGGLGILVLIVSVLPSTNSSSSILYRSETSLFRQEKIRPRIKDVAKVLWVVYIGIIGLGTLLLFLGGANLLDAFCNSVGAVATGGFSTKDASILGFHSLYIEIVAMVLMILGSISFSLHYRAVTRGPQNYFKKEQFKWYMIFLIAGTVLVTVILAANRTYGSIYESLRYGSFQTVSMMSTTGFSTASFENWPFAVQLLLVIFMFIGGMVGSTSGSIKMGRIIVVIKYVYREILRIIHPTVFAAVKMDDIVVMRDEVEKVVSFVIFYLLIFVAATILVCASGLDIVSSLSSVATTMGGVGPGLGRVGASSNFFELTIFAKCVLMFCMILGRLEIFAVIVLFAPAFWKK